MRFEVKGNIFILILISSLFLEGWAVASSSLTDPTAAEEKTITVYEPVVAYGERIEKPLWYRKWATPLMGLLFGIIQLWVYYDQDDDAATGALKVTGPPP